jgi:hypothetical protein
MVKQVRVGQLWKVNGITFRVESLDGPEGPHWPIVMHELERDPSVNQELDAMALASNARALTLQACYEPRRMNVEARWFERTDVRRVADCGDSGCRYARRPLRGMRTQGGKCHCDDEKLP